MIYCDICSNQNHDTLWKINGYAIMRCKNCSLVFAKVEEKDIQNAYEGDYYKLIYPDYEKDKNIHDMNNQLVLEEIGKYFSCGCLVEIGSAFGFFLQMAEKMGWDAQGYEISKYASEIAKQKYHQKVKNEDFLFSNTRNGVNLVCMFDTIEHLLSPSKYIKKIYQILQKGGGLVLTTGDISSVFAKMCGKKWRMMAPPLHIYYYSKETITNLLNKNGFEVISITHNAKYQNINSALKLLFGINKASILKIPIKINLWDIMQVIAIKR